MPIQRIPLSQPIETRDGTLSKDSKSVNGYFESRDQKREFIKRPGLALNTELPTGEGQGLFYFQNQLYAVVNNNVYKVAGDGTYTLLGTVNGDINTCYFTQSSPVPANSTNTISGNLTLTVAGTVDWTVPTGVTLIYATIVGAGGGGGGSVFSGDGHGAANGGSGGYYKEQPIIVSPSEVLTFTVGAGGAGNASYGTGSTGGASSIKRGTTVVYSATGGTGGAGVFGDNAPAFGGTGGLPNGVNGSNSASWMVNRNTPGQGYAGKGQNITGYGSGGLGGNSVGGAALGGTGLVGSTGAIIINY